MCFPAEHAPPVVNPKTRFAHHYHAHCVRFPLCRSFNTLAPTRMHARLQKKGILSDPSFSPLNSVLKKRVSKI